MRNESNFTSTLFKKQRSENFHKKIDGLAQFAKNLTLATLYHL